MAGALKLYKSYVFKDKDPVIDRIRTMVQDEGVNYNQVHELSGVASSTLSNWFDGDTRRPQFATIMAVTLALGYDVEFVKKNGAHTTHVNGRRRRRFA